MSSNGNKIELPASIVIRDLAQKIEKSPIDLIKKLMSNGVMATINQSVDFDTAAIVVAEYGFEATPEVVEEVKVETGEVPLWRQLIAGEDETQLKDLDEAAEAARTRAPVAEMPPAVIEMDDGATFETVQPAPDEPPTKKGLTLVTGGRHSPEERVRQALRTFMGGRAA